MTMTALEWLKARWIHVTTTILVIFCEGCRGFSAQRTSSKQASAALEHLCTSLDLQPTEDMKGSFYHCPELIQAISSQYDDESLSQWLCHVGRIPKQRLTQMIVKHPLMLARAITSPHFESISNILSSRLGMNETDIKKLFKSRMSHRWSRSNVRQLLYLLLDDLRLSTQQAIKVLRKHSQLLNYRVETLRSSVIFLRNELGLDVERIVIRRPMVLTYSVERQLRPTVTILQDCSNWRRMIESYPQLLQYSHEGILKPKMLFLKEVLQLDFYEDALHMVSSYPPVLWLTYELLQTKMDFFRTRLKLKDAELRYIMTSFPQLLGLSVQENLIPTTEFLLEELSLEQLQEFFLYQPSLLAYSLENRLRPRIELLQSVSISFGYSPPYLMSLSDAKFQQWVEMNTASWSPLIP